MSQTMIHLKWIKFGVNESERPGHQQRLLQTFAEDVFIFSLLVYGT